jgi:hypothetical protein
MKDSYVATKLGPYPEPPLYSGKELDEARKLYRERFLNMYAALSRGYVENALSVRVPFFGITFDVNDLGIMGGISFLVILVWLRFCISREVDNLRLSFEEADRLGKGKEFYTLLAMRQVLTTPRTRYLKRSKFLVVAPKIIVWAAFMVHIGVVIHDFNTRDLAIGLKLGRYQLTMIAEVLLAIPLFVLSVMVTKRLIRMDRVWDRAWVTINKPEAGGGMKSSQAGALA